MTGVREWVYDAELPAGRDATRAVELACGAYMAGHQQRWSHTCSRAAVTPMLALETGAVPTLADTGPPS